MSVNNYHINYSAALRPRVLGIGGILITIGALLAALPQFLSGIYEYSSTDVTVSKNGDTQIKGMCVK